MKTQFRTLVMIGLIATGIPSFAWNDTGHMVIASIGEGRLDEKAWKECDRLLKIGGTDTTRDFIQASCWADDTKSKDTAPWHYIDLPFRRDGKPVKTKPAEENVVWAINHFSDILKDKTKSDAERADALRYLIHFVADVHQPLHAATLESDEHPDGDHGGVDYPITTGELFKSMQKPPVNLHALWDMGAGIFPPGLVERPLGPESEGRIRIMGQTLTSQYPISKVADLAKDLDPNDWAQESNSTAQNIAYKVRTGNQIDLEYVMIAKVIAGQRAALSGYRLAGLLNKLLG